MSKTHCKGILGHYWVSRTYLSVKNVEQNDKKEVRIKGKRFFK